MHEIFVKIEVARSDRDSIPVFFLGNIELVEIDRRE